MTDIKITNAIRALAIDTVQGANSGHPGAPMGMAPISNVLFSEVMNYDASDSQWHNRDRFVLSNGHASALIYTMLHLTGYKLPMEELKRFRQLGSKTPGHPERGVTDGVEVTTGPLGQGISNAVGMAVAEAHLAATFNQPEFSVVDHFTYCYCGDGCLMEGVAQEALSLAGHLALEKLIIVYDDNFISIDGSTELAYTEKKEDKYRALGFHVILVEDGDGDYAAMRAALLEAKAVTGKPKMICLRTTIGKDAKLEGTAKVHGAPLGDAEIARVKGVWGRPADQKYHVEAEVYDHFQNGAGARGQGKNAEWKALMVQYKAKFPELATQYDDYYANTAKSADWEKQLPLNTTDGKAVATRKASENSLAVLMPNFKNIIGGSADLTGSNLTRPGEAALVDFQKATPEGRYIRFGVREHAMCAMCNGIEAHGGLIAFGATFLNFIGYALGAVRLSAMSHHGSIYVATHDSIGLGEDGPTHQPIELVVGLRATPNLNVWRPADQTETSAAWAHMIKTRTTPAVICLSRQNVPSNAGADLTKAQLGAYTISGGDIAQPELVLIGTGTELSVAVEGAKKLTDAGLKVKVVSMPSTNVYDKQSAEYKAELFPQGVPILSIEAYSSMGWSKYSHYHIGIDTFGGSAPAPDLYKFFKVTADEVADKGIKLVAKLGTNAPATQLVL